MITKYNIITEFNSISFMDIFLNWMKFRYHIKAILPLDEVSKCASYFLEQLSSRNFAYDALNAV